MPETPRVSFEGIDFGGARAYGWAYTSGTKPVDRFVVLGRERAAAIEPLLGAEGTIRIGEREWKRVTPIEIHPGADPFTRRVRFVDFRWKWPKRWVASTLNLRRATGDKFLAGSGRLENKLIQPDIKYARYSLYPPDDPGEPWTAREALRYFLEDELGETVRFKDEPPTELEIQDLTLDDEGDAAVERLLAYLPGMNLYPDREGEVVVYDTQSGEEEEILAGAPAPHAGGGMVELVDKRAIRPSKVVVLFTREVELRLDFREGGTRTDDAAEMVNIAPLPDATLTIAGETYARSTYLPLLSLFDAWGAFGKFSRKMRLEDLRKTVFGRGWANFEQIWGNPPLQPFDAVHAARAAAAVDSWRRLYRIDKHFLQRLAGIRGYRASIINPLTGAYAPAEAYCDWVRRPSKKGYVRELSSANVSQGWAVRGYAENVADAEAAPALVQVLDEQAGVIRVDPKVDPRGNTQAMAWGYPANGLPTQILGDANRTADEFYKRWDLVHLEEGFKLAVVLTCVPGSPNTIDRFHQVEVEPPDDAGESNGPPVYVRIFPGVMTARFGWEDGRGDEIEAAVRGEGPLGEDLLINPSLVDDVAQAAASRVYEPLLDRPLGSMSVDAGYDVEPGGTVESVSYDMLNGITRAGLTFAAARQLTSLWRYLDASTRQVILRIANQPRQS